MINRFFVRCSKNYIISIWSRDIHWSNIQCTYEQISYLVICGRIAVGQVRGEARAIGPCCSRCHSPGPVRVRVSCEQGVHCGRRVRRVRRVRQLRHVRHVCRVRTWKTIHQVGRISWIRRRPVFFRVGHFERVRKIGFRRERNRNEFRFQSCLLIIGIFTLFCLLHCFLNVWLIHCHKIKYKICSHCPQKTTFFFSLSKFL